MASDENDSDTQGYFGFYRDSNNSITSDSKHSKSSKKDKKEKTGYQHFTKSSSEEEIINKKTSTSSDKKSKSLFKFTNIKEKTPKLGKDVSQPTSSTKNGKPYSALPTNFFRLPLQEALKYDCHDDGVPLPTFVRSCIDYIEEHGEVARKEGIYKKSVGKALLEKVKSRYVETGFVDWVEHSSPRSLAPTLLRHYVKHLPLPLIPLCVELSLMQQVGILRERQQSLGKNGNKNNLAEDLQTPLNCIKTTLNEKLPISHWYMLAYLLSHFLHLFAFESENKFNLSNCIHLFAPLLRLHPKLLKILLIHYKELFPGLVIKRLSKPIEGEADSADNIDMPNCLSDLEKELATQESALKELHAKMQQPIQPSHHKNVEKCLTLKQEPAATVDRGKIKIKHAQSFTKGSSGVFYSKYGKKTGQNEVVSTKGIDDAKAPKEITVKKLEDELWEVQRRVTQLKRKIRLCKQAEYPKMPEELLEPGKILEPRKMGPFQVLAGKFLEPMKATIPTQGQASSLNDVSLIIPLNENDLQFVEQSFDDQLTSNQGTEGDSIVDKESKNIVKALKYDTAAIDLNGVNINVEVKGDSDGSAISSMDLTDFEDSLSSYSSPDQGNDKRLMGDRHPDHFVNFSLPNDWENSFTDNNTNTGFDVCFDDDFKDDVAFCENPLEDSSILNEAFTRLVELILPLTEHQDETTPLKIIPLTVPIVTLLAYLIQEKLLLEEGEKLKNQVESDTKVLKQQTKRLREKMLLSQSKQQSIDLESCKLQKISPGCGINENIDSIHEELTPLVSKDEKGYNMVKDLERCNQVLEKTNADIIDNLYYQNNEIIGTKIKIFLMSLLTFLSDEGNIVSGSWNNYNFKIIGVAYRDYFPCHVMATKRDVLAIDIFHAR